MSQSLTAKQQFWSDKLQEAERSGQTLADYARIHNLPAQKLYQWICIYESQARQAKDLVLGENGFCLGYKSLEKERFKWPKLTSPSTTTLDGEQLNWLNEGFDLWNNKPHARLYYESVG